MPLGLRARLGTLTYNYGHSIARLLARTSYVNDNDHVYVFRKCNFPLIDQILSLAKIKVSSTFHGFHIPDLKSETDSGAIVQLPTTSTSGHNSEIG